MRKELHEENRRSWNEATKAHNSHKGDQARFFRSGGSTLFPEEQELLGHISGLKLLHLQCNSGQDTLSLASCGADVTGVDISDEAITFAQRLAEESDIPARFYRSDVYDWLETAAREQQRFDIAFCSYGAICWLSDLRAWAAGIAAILSPGGRFVTIDFHPMAMIFDEHWTPAYDYFTEGNAQTWEDGIGDYVARARDALAPWGYEEGIKDFRNPYRVHEFQWSISQIVSALLEAGLTLETLREYPYSNGAMLFESMRQASGRRMFPPAGLPKLPLMYAITARKLRQDDDHC